MKTLVLEGKQVRGTEAEKTLKLLPPVKSTEAPVKIEEATVNALIEKFAPKTPPTAEERIKRITHFEALSKRFQTLKDKDNDLKLFVAGNDKMTAKINLENQAGFKFDVRNSNVIDKVLSTMQAELNILLSEAENEVLNFEI
jgi:hypothetical protein